VLPVAQYPEITPPTVIISASFPGANAETLSKTVAAPIEEQLSGVEGLLYYNSQSGLQRHGQPSPPPSRWAPTRTWPLIAVNNRVKVAEPRLPDDVVRTGVQRAEALQQHPDVGRLRSPDNTFDALYLSNYVSLNIEEIRRIPGVGDAQLFDPIYAMRVWLKPDVMAKLGITTSDVAAAIASRTPRTPPARSAPNRCQRPAAHLHRHRQGPPADPRGLRQHRAARRRPQRPGASEGRGAHRTGRRQLRPQRPASTAHRCPAWASFCSPAPMP
jgi:multidrug efflux pump subunit AcrB